MKHKKTCIQKCILDVNVDELIFDVLLVIYAKIFIYRVVTGGRGLVDIMGPNALFPGGMCANFLYPVVPGYRAQGIQQLL
jgi:hypothetical protein